MDPNVLTEQHWENCKNVITGPWLWWSVYSPSTPMIQVRILLTSTVFSVQFVFEINNYKQNRGRGWPIFHKNVITSKLAVKYFVIFQQLSFSPID